MKKLLSLALLAMFGAVIVGCEASGHVGDPDRPGKTEVKKTTVRDRDGDVHQKTEVNRKYD